MTRAVDLLAAHGGREFVAQAFGAEGFPAELAYELLAARTALVGAGNRRKLFNRFDALLGEAAPDVPKAAGEPEAPAQLLGAATDRGMIQLRRIKLRNWKVFDRAEFAFPPLSPERPVILIGGKNGYGKTSVLEAILFGLYGERALLDVDRALRGDSPGPASSRGATYRQMIDRAFHEPARARGDEVASVLLAFDTDEGPFEVERRWYYRTDGRSSEEDETLTLWAGEGLDVVAVPDGEEPNIFYQDEIARRLMPVSVAPFFLFDGEQVKRLAERQMADQVRLGVESVLGLHAWRDTVADLRDYARDRGRGGGQAEDLARMSAAADELGAQEAATSDALAALEQDLSPLRSRRDALVSAIGALGGGTFESVADLHELQHRLTADLGRRRSDLTHSAGRDLPLVLAGAKLQAQLAAAIGAEQQGHPASEALKPEVLDALLTSLDAEDDSSLQITPELLHERVRRAWARLAAGPSREEVRHHVLDGRLRGRVLERLHQGASGVATFQQTLEAVRGLETELARVRAAISEHGTRDANDGALRSELAAVTTRIDDLEQRRRDLDQALGRVASQRRDAVAQLDVRPLGRKTEVPDQERAANAQRAALALERVIKTVGPLCFKGFAAAVSRTYRALAHKSLVDQVTIDAEGAVSLVDKMGRYLRNFDMSAGESQVFAMALIAAVAEIARTPMPLVIDTPLGRLDPDHRERILTFFSSQPRQTILLSQPDEVNGRYLALIQDRVAAQFRLDHEAGEGVGGSTPHEGYFPNVAA